MTPVFHLPIRELPPRARRIQGLKGKSMPTPRTTSACAENTLATGVGLWLHGNYLRVRGEYDCFKTSITSSWELPPRARRIP